MDNREAMAYVIYRQLKCSREAALNAVSDLCEVFPGVARIAVKRWRNRRKVRKEDVTPPWIEPPTDTQQGGTQGRGE